MTDVIRPFRDSPITVKRRWYRVPEGTPLLGFPSAFLSAHNEAFPWMPRAVGEVYPPQITYGRRRTPTGLTFDHACGTRDQWQHGAVFDPTFNSHPDEEWIPECCGRIEPPVRGGLEMGGACGDLFTEFNPVEGGLQLGGEVGDVADQVDAVEGGLQLGGQSGASGDYLDPVEGGLQLGGEVGDVADQVDAVEGGLQLGGEVGDVFRTVDAVEGGLQLGGAVGDVVRHVDPVEGGLQLGGAVGDDYLDITSIPGYVYGEVYNGGTTTTVSATPVDSGTPMSVVFTLAATTNVWVTGITTGITGGGANGGILFADVDGTDLQLASYYSANDVQACACAGSRLFVLGAGTHTIKLQFAASAGTANFTDKSLKVERGV